jgi:hypothetical protein
MSSGRLFSQFATLVGDCTDLIFWKFFPSLTFFEGIGDKQTIPGLLSLAPLVSRTVKVATRIRRRSSRQEPSHAVPHLLYESHLRCYAQQTT